MKLLKGIVGGSALFWACSLPVLGSEDSLNRRPEPNSCPVSLRSQSSYSFVWQPQIRNRILNQYEDILGGVFSDSLYRLNENSLWMDWGMGSGIAIADFVYRLEKLGRPVPKILGIDHQRLASPVFEETQSRYPERLVFLEASAELSFVSPLGMADLATDLMGPLSYTSEFSTVLRHQIAHLKVGGTLMVRLGRKHFFQDAEGRPISLERLLNEKARGVRAGFQEGHWLIQIVRTHEMVEIPDTQRVFFQAEMPPQSTFRLAVAN